ncbi:MAG TPA: DUF4349 domain-containing protein [Solirubrobacteraceae bacterium]|jgi:hypothetical protein|nr:DUF4349 domain-containing protein [Solirubrobacteraceae bacterium]
MSRHEDTPIGADVRRDLDAIDAALGGEPLDATRGTVAGLALELRDMRPEPQPEFVRALDERAAQGFRRERTARRFGGLHLRPGLPALGAAAACAAVLVALVTALGGSGGAVMTSHVSPQARSGAGSAVRTQQRGPISGPSSGAGAGKGVLAPAPAPEAPAAGTARHIERTASLDVGVAPDQVQAAARRVFTLVASFGGYVRQSSVSTGSGSEGGATFDVRLPAGNIASAIAALSRLGHVRSENDTTNDVTDQYDALRGSLGEARAERAGLLRRLAAAGTTAESEALRAAVHRLDARIAQLLSALHALTSRIDYTPLALSLTPEAQAQGGGAFGDLTPGGAAHDAARLLEAALAVLVIGAAAMLPLALVAIAGWAALVLARRRLREQALDANP